jgi:NAD(P)-dependent dehydrogenase (short-subunit alcohol dehydrogenase family)
MPEYHEHFACEEMAMAYADMEGKPLALVTGASSGIGYELAREFAAHDFDVVMVAEDPERLATAAKTLQALATAPQVEAVIADLAAAKASSASIKRCRICNGRSMCWLPTLASASAVTLRAKLICAPNCDSSIST